LSQAGSSSENSVDEFVQFNTLMNDSGEKWRVLHKKIPLGTHQNYGRQKELLSGSFQPQSVAKNANQTLQH
jgi:hypothetical protein